MSTYSYEFKKQVVDDYLAGKGSFSSLGVKYNIASPLVGKWVSIYSFLGDQGISHSEKNRRYSLEFKQSIVESYIRGENESYGYRTMCAELRRQGHTVNKKKVQRLMQDLNLQVTSYTRKSRKYSSYKGKVGTVAPNRIRRRFNTCIPHQKITTDTSEFKYYEIDSKGHMTINKLYLDPYFDMFNGEIISYSISKRPTAKSIQDALERAIKVTSDCRYRRTFHSDQGWAYQMKSYTYRLKEEGIYQSMSRRGNCHDNSVMENFFGLLKQEIYYGKHYNSYESLKAEIERWIKYYNEKRIKKRLGWCSPVEYRLKTSNQNMKVC